MFLSTIKTRSQQIIPLCSKLLIILREYLKFRQGQPEDYLFCTLKGEKLTTRGLQTNISNYNKSRGVMKTSIHLLRHAFARDWILAGGDVFTLQNLLGHSTSAMTKHYVNVYGRDILKTRFNEINPLNKYSKDGTSNIKLR